MDVLDPQTTLIRLFKTPDQPGWIAFHLTPDEIRASAIPDLDGLSLPDGQTVYIAYEHPEDLPPRLRGLCALSGTHLVRAFQARKPFKRIALALPKDTPETAVPGPEGLSGIHTLILKGRVGVAATIPVRPGERPRPFLSWEPRTGPGRRIRLETILAPAASLSLALTPDAEPSDLFLAGHFSALLGCPALIAAGRESGSDDWVPAFLSAYAGASADGAREKVWTDENRAPVLVGYQGMTPEEAQSFAADHFEAYVQKGQDAFTSGQPLTALNLFESALAIAREMPRFAEYLAPLLQLSREAAFQAGDMDRARDHAADLARLIAEREPDTQAHAEALLALGLIHARMEAYDEAVPALEQVVEMMTALDLGPELAQALADLGVVLENATAYDRALTRFTAAATVSRNWEKTELLAAQHAHIGRLYDLRLSRYAAALREYTQALELYQGLGQTGQVVQMRINAGRCYRLLGNFPEADRLYADAQTEAASLGDVPDGAELAAKILIEQANNAWFKARYQDAFDLQRKAYHLAMEHDLPLLRIIALNTSGLIWWTLGDPDKSMSELETALKQARELPGREDEVATTLNNRGLIFRDTGRLDQALASFGQAREIDERLGSRWGLAYDLRNLGLTRIRMGQSAEAVPLLEQAIAVTADIGDAVNQAKSLLAMGQARLSLGQTAEAGRCFQQALDLSRSVCLRETEWRALHGQAQCVRQTDPSAARDLLYQAVAVVEGMRADIKIEQLRDSFIVDKLDVYESLVALLVGDGRIEAAFEVAERSRARNLIDLLGNQDIRLSGDVDQALLDSQKKIRARIAEQEALLAQTGDPDMRTQARASVDRLRVELHSAMLDIQAAHPDLASLVSVPALKAADLYKELPPGLTLLSYYMLSDAVLCWVIGADGIHLVQTPIGRETLGESLLEYRRMIQNLEPLDARSQSLFKLLVAPVMPHLGGTRVLGIIPHGPLHYLSFATLDDGSGYLIDRFPLFYMPGAGIFPLLKQRRFTEKNLKVLAVGNPDLKDPAFDLPFAGHEVKTIQWRFPNITVLTGPKATESWVAENISDYGIIHLATHGEFNPINPLFSAIKLAQGGDRDGNLEALEVFGLRIRADLVVLSACQTGLGKVTAGDDVIGLNRSFLYAGTHAIISSLWRVSDVSTAVLIKQFYRRYATDDKAASLRRAMLHVKNQYPHPGYWGAFVLTGDYD